ncbi:unnamed protein product [Meganyctiphanes norvegica]|uniref:Uncharacterized protein n=1 Tax=Meganyctiphanes norvegica TaxID=48144 RepID=A0AAV2SC43_MEGNR
MSTKKVTAKPVSSLKKNPAFAFFSKDALNQVKGPEPIKKGPGATNVPPKKKSASYKYPAEEPSKKANIDKYTADALFKNFLELEKLKREGTKLSRIAEVERLRRIQELEEEQERLEEQQNQREIKTTEHQAEDNQLEQDQREIQTMEHQAEDNQLE